MNIYSLIKSNKTNITNLIIVIIIIILISYLVSKYLQYNAYKSIDHKEKVIVFGQTCDLENNTVSETYSLGYQFAFDLINKNGGINGYKLKLILLNDKYETDIAAKNATVLLDYYNVLGIVGPFGTPTFLSILNNVIGERNIPIIGPFSAGTSYRKEFKKNLILTNTSFYPELELICKNMVNNSIKRISVIYQNDAYGQYFFNVFKDYILEKNLEISIISTGSHERNSDHLTDCYKSLFDVDNPYNYDEYKNNTTRQMQGVLIFTAEKEIASILGQLKKIKPNLFIYYNFFVGTKDSNYKFLSHLNTKNIYQTNLIKNDLSNYPELESKLVKELEIYNENKSKENNIEISSSLIMGFYSGLLITKVLEGFKDDMTKITRETFIDMFYKLKTIDIYGFKIGPFILNKNNEGIKYAHLTQLQPNFTTKVIDKVEIEV
jgi:hypothetical protein